jgi:NADPH:quinone reductase-like Zn-dependent oxidoreductase
MDRRQFIAGAALAGAALGNKVHAGGHAGTRMGAWIVGDRQGIDALTRTDLPTPVPGPGEVLIDVYASAINARDLGIIGGPFPPNVAADRVPLSDGAGRVIAIGDGVTDVAIGDRVTANHFLDWLDGGWSPAFYLRDVGSSVNGWLADQVVLPAQNLVKLPAGMSFEQAATLPVAGVTAWHALFEATRVKPGDWVLSLGTGGVSSFGVKLALAAGANVAVTSSSDEKLATMRSLGATVAVNYRTTPQWGDAIREATGGGADIVLENVGRRTMDESMRACAVGGRLIMIGTGPLPEQLPTLPEIFQKNLVIRAISNASHRMLTNLVTAMDTNRIEPVIARVFEFDETPDALTFMARSGHLGKVVIRHRD